MKFLRRCILTVLILSLLIGICGCGAEEEATDTAPLSEESISGTVRETPQEKVTTTAQAEPKTSSSAPDTQQTETLQTETLQTETLQTETVQTDTQQTAGTGTASQTADEPTGSVAGEDNEYWTAYSAARTRTYQLTAREQLMMVYTRQGGSDSINEQTINMRVKTTGLDTLDPLMEASGTVKANGRLIPLQVYYVSGVKYDISGDNMTSEMARFEDALSSVDVMDLFSRELVWDYVLEIDGESSPDGTQIINLSFEGVFNGIVTKGSGEVVINGDGIIASQGFSMETVPDDGLESSVVYQSVECTMLGCGSAVKPVEIPEALLH